MLLDTLRLFLPKLRLTAFAPDGASASLANHLAISTIVRPPRRRDLIANHDERIEEEESDFRGLLDAIAWQYDLAIVHEPAERSGRAVTDALPWIFAHLTQRGEMVVVLPLAEEGKHFGNLTVPRFRRAAHGPLDGHVWLRVLAGDTVALFLAKTHLSDDPQRLDLSRLNEDMLAEHARRRPVWREGAAIYDVCDLSRDTAPAFADARAEYQRRLGVKGILHRDNFWMEADVLRVGFDGFQRRLQPALDWRPLDRLNLRPWDTLNPGELSRLRAALTDDRLRGHDDVRTRVRASEAADQRARAPFYVLDPAQRLGWLKDEQTIRCLRNVGPFVAGQSYSVRCQTGLFTRAHTRPNLFGEEEIVTLHARDTIFEVLHMETDARGYGTFPVWHRFADWTARHLTGMFDSKQENNLRHSLLDLVECFAIPAVPDVATLHPAEYQRRLDLLKRIEEQATDFAWRNFQRDDLARFTLHDGGIFALDKGGGKGLCLYAIPVLYGAKRTLIVAPEGLHDQICADWQAKFGLEPRRIMSVAAIDADADLRRALLDLTNRGESDVEGFWLTSYTALGYNGADEWPDEIDGETGEKLVNSKTIALRARHGVTKAGAEGIGHEIGGVRCVLAPSMATILRDVFDCVECDEAVRLKATDSFVSLGVRRMRPKYPVALTGTPVKNRLEDIYWLAHWCAGSPETGNARFPFPNTAAGREAFANLYMVREENHTKAEKYRAANPGKSRKFWRRLPQATNLHELWRVLGSLVLRRRKEDFGEEIVPKNIIPVKVKPGRAQLEVYRHHLNPPQRKGDQPMDERARMAQLLAQLGNLRMAACCPDAPNLKDGAGVSCSWTDHTPLLTGTFHLIVEQLEQGKQAMVAAPFQHFNRTLEARLKEAGVSCVRLDGDTSPKERGRLAALFKQRAFAVLLAGDQAMGEGHSFEQCPTLIRPALHWAFDVNSQVEDRVHRLTSPEPVNIYVLTVENSIAGRLLALYREKSDASAAAIDGRLFGGPEEEEVSLGALLREAQQDFDSSAATIDERTLEAEWPHLRDRLRLAEARFREWWPPIVADRAGKKVTFADVRRAVSLADLPSPAVATIHALPSATIALLAGSADPGRVAQCRRQFAAYVAAHPSGDWRQSWEQFRDLPKAQREAYDPDHQTQTIQTALNRLK